MKKDYFIPVSLVAFLLILIILKVAFAQYDGINDNIARHRKGTLIIKAKRGSLVVVEQVKHEFWFGAAISNQFGTGNMPEYDRKQYEEKFLMNFNSAVTENAVKWGSMEPQKGQVNYATVDGILNWTEKNHIPLRAHNLFWGIPNRVQPGLIVIANAFTFIINYNDEAQSNCKYGCDPLDRLLLTGVPVSLWV